jgi:hypothetical protein
MRKRIERRYPPKLYVGPALLSLLSLQCDASQIENVPCPELGAPDLITPGDTITVTGKDFGLGACDRSVGCAFKGEPQPLKDIEIELRQGVDVWPLGTVDANKDSAFRVAVLVPKNVAEGEALLTAADAELTVRVDGSIKE